MTYPTAEPSTRDGSRATRRHILAWFALLIIAIGNGALRDLGYGPLLSPLTAHQVSTLIAVLLSGAVAWWLARRWPLPNHKVAHTVGGVWLIATIAFEFLFGHFVMGHDWQRLLGDYDLSAGRVWPLFLAWTGLMPSIFYRWHGARKADRQPGTT